MDKPGRKPKLTNAQVVDALKKSHGLKTGAAELLGVAFETLEKYIARSNEAQGLVRHWGKRRTERAVYKLDEAIERGEAWAVALQLKNSTVGRDYGYGDRLDVTGRDGGPVQTQAVNVTPEELRAEVERAARELAKFEAEQARQAAQAVDVTETGE